ncbi:DUF4386 domain-containing protein [Miltoncostaea marina]|uniref:DUF4386 domain-containing protein n=1 Tax=Miltoncostaea marina TaxID=2843215 RepID=UPI001C3CA5F7|nr:DUF4386 domain-containing protein [Miltoncostaea marina]
MTAVVARIRAMTPLRRTALVAGLLYLVTFAASIPALALYDGVLNDPAFVHGAGSEDAVAWGAALEIILGVACVGTAVVLYPVLRRWSRALALGFVAARTLEAAMIFAGVLSLLSVLTLRQDATAGADAAALDTSAQALVALHDWSFLLGPGLMAVVNALCFGTIMYRSGLVPRIIPAVGLVGAPILLASGAATLFGLYDQVSAPAMLAALPIAAWELSVGVWMIVKGFRDIAPAQAAAEPAPAPSLQGAAA